jgi:hemerythrin-like domain-containing protein
MGSPVHATRPAPATDGATATLTQDHERLRDLLQRAAGSVAGRRVRQARADFRAFQLAFERHVRNEEEIVFPLFEVRVGLVGGPTVLMRDEHQRMADQVRSMAGALDCHDPAAFAEAQARFSDLFQAHTAKEERFLYTTLDRLLSSEQRAAVGGRLRQS